MNIQYIWIAIVIVGIVGGVEIGYAVSTNIHNPYGMHNQFFKQHDGWYHNSGYMMQDPDFRQQMYSGMFDSSKFRDEMSQYLADHPEAMKSWCNTMMNNPHAMQTMQNMMGQGMMGGMMIHGMNISSMNGMMNQNKTQESTMGMQGMSGMGNMSSMGNMMHH